MQCRSNPTTGMELATIQLIPYERVSHMRKVYTNLMSAPRTRPNHNMRHRLILEVSASETRPIGKCCAMMVRRSRQCCPTLGNTVRSHNFCTNRSFVISKAFNKCLVCFLDAARTKLGSKRFERLLGPRK